MGLRGGGEGLDRAGQGLRRNGCCSRGWPRRLVGPRACEVGPERRPLLGHKGSSVFATRGAGVLRTGMILITTQESEGRQCDLQ